MLRPYHGQIKLLHPNDSENLLERNHFGHLGCAFGNDVYVIPISYLYEGGLIYFHTRPGKKVKSMNHDSHVCLQVEEIEDFYHWKSAAAFGKVERLNEPESTIAMRRIIEKMTLNETIPRISELEVDFSALIEKSIVYKMKPAKISGRFEAWPEERSSEPYTASPNLTDR